MEKENSFAMEMLKELSQQNKRLGIIIIIIASLWFSSIVGFGLYLNQYDYTTETYTADSEDYGTAIINEGGEINIGEGDEDN
jgi:hypothetical protein